MPATGVLICKLIILHPDSNNFYACAVSTCLRYKKEYSISVQQCDIFGLFAVEPVLKCRGTICFVGYVTEN